MADEDRSEKIRIPKLEGSKDYAVWKIYLLELLVRDDVLFVLNEDAPEATASAAARNRWKKADTKARSHIVLNLGEEPVISVSAALMEGASAKDIWNKLEAVYQKENIQSKLNLRARLHSMKFKPEENFQSQIKDFEKIFLDLARLNDPVSPEDKVGSLLQSLPSSL